MFTLLGMILSLMAFGGLCALGLHIMLCSFEKVAGNNNTITDQEVGVDNE